MHKLTLAQFAMLMNWVQEWEIDNHTLIYTRTLGEPNKDMPSPFVHVSKPEEGYEPEPIMDYKVMVDGKVNVIVYDQDIEEKYINKLDRIQ